jgi:large subunit ribosomal protein L5
LSPKQNQNEETPKEVAAKANPEGESLKEKGAKASAKEVNPKEKSAKTGAKEASPKEKGAKAGAKEVSPKEKGAKAGAKEVSPKEEGAKDKAPKAKVERIKPRLKEKYSAEVMPALNKEFGYKNVMQVPRLKKVVVSIGLGEAITNPKALEAAEKDLSTIAGQHPVITKSKRSISAFKLRTGMPIGMMVTLRGDRMYHFLDRLYNVVLPRLRDFQGISRESFDGRGNYSLGMKEQIVFPEIDYDKVDKLRGMEVTIVTSAKNDDEARRLLELMGMPFHKAERR